MTDIPQEILSEVTSAIHSEPVRRVAEMVQRREAAARAQVEAMNLVIEAQGKVIKAARATLDAVARGHASDPASACAKRLAEIDEILKE